MRRRTMAAIPCALLAAGCSSGGRYLVDGELLRMIEAPLPPAVRVDDAHREVGSSTVEIACDNPGEPDERSLYRGVVDGTRGRWKFSVEGPIRPGATSCAAPEALDEMAEHAALRYRKAHAAVPAVREASGDPVFLDEKTAADGDAATARRPGLDRGARHQLRQGGRGDPRRYRERLRVGRRPGLRFRAALLAQRHLRPIARLRRRGRRGSDARRDSSPAR